MSKRVFSVMLIVVVMLGVCVVATGCPSKKESYDFSIEVVRYEVNENGYIQSEPLEEWIFTLDVNELTTEMDYDGKRYCYRVIQYNMPDHPEDGDIWFPEDGLHDIFSADLLWWQEDRKATKEVKFVCEKGDYTFDIQPWHPGEWNLKYRHMILRIKIK